MFLGGTHYKNNNFLLPNQPLLLQTGKVEQSVAQLPREWSHKYWMKIATKWACCTVTTRKKNVLIRENQVSLENTTNSEQTATMWIGAFLYHEQGHKVPIVSVLSVFSFGLLDWSVCTYVCNRSHHPLTHTRLCVLLQSLVVHAQRLRRHEYTLKHANTVK